MLTVPFWVSIPGLVREGGPGLGECFLLLAAAAQDHGFHMFLSGLDCPPERCVTHISESWQKGRRRADMGARGAGILRVTGQ